ncbi:MAG: lipopolysaccharide biosynthesis protein [Steroidobacteraceae bacterium]
MKGFLPTAGNKAWFIAPTLVGAALPLLTLPLITRTIDPTDYGYWVLAYSFAAFVSGVGNFGLSIAYERNFYEFTDTRTNAALLWTTVSFVVLLLGLFVTTTWLLRDSLSVLVMRAPAHAELLAWTVTAVAVGSIKTYFLLHLRNNGNARAFAFFNIDESLTGAIATVVLVVFLKVGVLGLAWGPLIASSLVLGLLVLRFVRRVPIVWQSAPLVASLRLSLPLLPRILLGVVGTQFDKWIVGYVGTSAGAAVYAIGQRLANSVFLLATALENAFQPRTYRLMFDGGPAAGAQIGRMLTPYVYLIVAFAVAMALFAEEAIFLLADRSYRGGAIVADILVLHFALMFFGKQPQLTFARRSDLNSLIGILSLVLTGTITAVFAVHWLAVGAAVGTLLAGALSTGIFQAVSQRYYRIEYEWRTLLGLYGYLAVCCVLAVFRPWQGVSLGLVLVIKSALLAALLYAGWRRGWLRRDGLGA